MRSAIICLLACFALACTTESGVEFHSCLSDADCPDGQVCSDRGICIVLQEDGDLPDDSCDPAECEKDSDCENDEVCTDGGCCVPYEAPECYLDEDCDEEEICFEGECRSDDVCEDEECSKDSDCEDGEYCSDDCECIELPTDGDIVLPDGDLPSDGDLPDGDGPVDGDIPSDGDIPTDGDVPDDRDKDGVLDIEDNCPDIPNPRQEDFDDDGIGDICDNCPENGNYSQTNTDNDSLGDACDNCPNIDNESQENSDDDKIGDACDNCRYADNDDQEDEDQDGIGDECDPTPEEGPYCKPVECQPIDVSFLNPCPDLGMECVKDESAQIWEPGYCESECSTSNDCPSPFSCINGICACSEGPNECIMYACNNADYCESWGFGECSVIPGYDERVCTDRCGNNADCPYPYNCTNGWCGCGGIIEPDICPSDECENGADCEAIGFPPESACMLSTNYCTMPCREDDLCYEWFGENWYCENMGSEGSWCICGEAPEPEQCPSGECWSRNDCYDAGWPEEARCLVPVGQCTLPCENDRQCRDEFGDQWSCKNVAGNNYCTCQD